MQSHFNLEVVIVTIATLLLLLFANISEARDLNGEIQPAVYENSDLLNEGSMFTKVSSSRYYRNRYYRNRHYGYRSNRNFYRNNRFY